MYRKSKSNALNFRSNADTHKYLCVHFPWGIFDSSRDGHIISKGENSTAAQSKSARGVSLQTGQRYSTFMQRITYMLTCLSANRVLSTSEGFMEFLLH